MPNNASWMSAVGDVDTCTSSSVPADAGPGYSVATLPTLRQGGDNVVRSRLCMASVGWVAIVGTYGGGRGRPSRAAS